MGFEIMQSPLYAVDASVYNMQSYASVLPKISIITGEKIDFQPGMHSQTANLNGVRQFVSDDYLYFESSNDQFLITPTKIALTSNCGAPGEFVVRCLSMGTVFASRFHKRAILHGGAFLHEAKAYLVIATSGVGKSTLCAAMRMYQKCEIISDDALLIQEEGTKLFDGLHMVKLVPTDMKHMVRPCDEFMHSLEVHPEQSKYLFLWDSTDRRNWIYPIGGILFLDSNKSTDTCVVKTISSLENMILLSKNIKGRRFIFPIFYQQELEILHRLSLNVPAYRVSIEKGFEKLPKITEKILSSLK